MNVRICYSHFNSHSNRDPETAFSSPPRLRSTLSKHRLPPRSPFRGLRPSNGISRVLHLSPPRDPTHSLILKKKIRRSFKSAARVVAASADPQVRPCPHSSDSVPGFRLAASQTCLGLQSCESPESVDSWRCRFRSRFLYFLFCTNIILIYVRRVSCSLYV